MANSYLNRTTGSPTNSAIWTLSAWIKRSSLSGSQKFFAAGSSGTDRTEMYFAGTTGEFYIYRNISGSTIELGSTRMFRDTSAWYNFVVQNNNGTVAVYVNGETVSMSNSTSLGTNKINNASTAHYIGRQVADTSQNFDGYMSHVSFVDGSVVAPTVFGETDSTSGIWKFKSPSGVTWGNNGFHLKFENSGALGTDSSGNTNTFTVNGDLKQALDTPSNVYCTINPLYRMDLSNNATMSNGNTTFSSDQSGYNIRYGTLGVNKGKWYYEAKFISHNPQTSPGMPFGISGSQIPAGQQNAGYAQYDYSYNYDGSNGTVQANNTATNYGTLPLNTIGQIGMCAFDLDNNKLYFGVNGVWTNSGNPGGNSNGFFIAEPDDTELGFYFPSTADRSSNRSYVYSFNFGNGFFGTTAITSAGSNGNGSLFEYDCPTGYYALNTKNINTYG